MRVLLLMLALSLSPVVSAEITFQVYVPYEGFSPDQDGLERGTLKTIRSEKEWEHFWRQLEQRLSRQEPMRAPYRLPKIDFLRHTLVVLALGSRPSSGYSIAMRSIAEYPSHYDVSALELHPGQDCVVLTAVTYPIAFVIMPRTDKEVRIHLRKAAVPCG